MSPKAAFEKIHAVLLEEVPNALAAREGVRSEFRELLGSLYLLILRAIETGESVWLDSLLEEWVTTPTETQLEATKINLVEVINKILISTTEVIRKELDPPEGLKLLAALLPIFTHAIEYVSIQEANLRVEHITNELSQAKNFVEKLEKSKSDFISVAAHELKTPLTLIEGYSSMLRDSIITDDSNRVQVNLCLKGVDAGTTRLKEIVDDMIDVSLIDNDLLSLAFQPVWLYQIFHAIERELDDIIVQRKLKYSLKQFPGLNEMIFGDGERLFQALRNVVNNAIKYTPDGGSITINGRSLPGFIEVIISDTGIGIDPEDHGRIFEKFGRLGNASLHSSGKTKFKGGGPGLGLPIAKGIIDSHGGTIWVESEGFNEDTCPGSTFHIMIPLRKSPPDDKTAKLFRDFTEKMKSEQ
jgi:signal transduction histidine kinase